MADPLDTNGDGVVDDTELLAGFNKPVEEAAVEEVVVETDEELIASLSALESKQKQAAGEPEDLTMMDRLRLAGQGLSFNWSDEAIAGIKALSPNVTYEDALSQEREINKLAREKDGALKYEIGGAFVPTIAALALTPFTGGTSAAATAPTWLRLMGIGATQGLAMGTGSSEEEGLARLKDAPTAVVTGAVANPAFAKLSQGAQKAAAPLFDYVKRKVTGKVGKKVEDELLRILKESGLTPEDVFERVSKGEIIPEMSEEGYRVIAGFVREAGPGAPIVRNAVVGRKNAFVEDLYKSLQNDLAPDSQGGNIFETFANNTTALKKAEGEAYDRIFDGAAGQTFQEIDDVVLSLATASRNSRNLINKKLDENGLKPIFKMVGKGKNAKLQLTRSLSLKEGELVKRAFMDAKIGAKAKKPDKAKTMKVYENQIKEVVDNLSDELKTTRKSWAMIEDSVNQFEAGQRIFSAKTNPEEFSIMFGRLLEAGNADAIAALRAGAASALKLKSGGPQKLSMINKLADDPLTNMSKNEQQILQALYPGEKLDDIITKINLTSGAIKAEGNIFKGSPTAGREGAANRVGLGQTVADIGRVVTSGGTDILATAGIVTRLFGGKKPPFTDEQFEQIAKLVVSEDSEVLRQALTDDAQVVRVLEIFRKAIDALGASQPRVTALTNVTESVGEDVDPVVSGALEGIINRITPDAKQKVIQAQ